MKTLQKTRTLKWIDDYHCTLTVKGVSTTYFVTPYGHGESRRILWCKPDAEPYSVRKETHGYSCTCPGHVNRGRCKHADATAASVKLGKI